MNIGSDFETFIFICPHCQYQTKLPEAFEGLMHTCENCKVKSFATATTEKICPSCGKSVDISAKKCQYCQQDFIDISILLKKLESDLGIKMIEIPAGSFMMGSPESEYGRDFDEFLHHVVIKNKFWISDTMITAAQYRKFMKYSTTTHAAKPVLVLWADANKFIEKINCKYADEIPVNHCFDLPSEEQWEYACRAGTTSALYNGKNLSGSFWGCKTDDLKEIACFEYFSLLQPVKTKKPNAWGLFDMLGNCYEWCRDLYYLYSGDTNSKSLERLEWLKLRKEHRIICGGCRGPNPACCRSAHRSISQTEGGEHGWAGYHGFRIILEEK